VTVKLKPVWDDLGKEKGASKDMICFLHRSAKMLATRNLPFS
jgi:hypothetical protein